MYTPAKNSFCIGQNFSWFSHKLIMPTTTDTKIIIVTTKYLNAELKQTNKNTLLSPSDTIPLKAIFQLGSILSNVSSALKPQQSPIFKVPRVSTNKPVSVPTWVSPYTTQDFHNTLPETQ